MELEIGDTFGAMFIGALVTMCIYGITTMQTYFYFMYYPRDGLSLKLLVAIIWVLDTLHVIFMCHAMHYYLISSYGKPQAFADGTWSLFASLAVNVLMAFVVQCFFTQRIYILSPSKIKWWLSSIIGFSVVAHFCFGMETVILFFIKRQFSRLKEVQLVSALPFGVTAILSDILIAVTLCLLLDQNRSDFEDTNSLINKLIVFAINCCVLTSAMAVVEIIVFVILPNSFYSFAIDFIIGKLYANSLLASLNSRDSLRTRHDSSCRDISTGFNLATIMSRPGSLIQVASREHVVESDCLRPADAGSKHGTETVTGSSTHKSRRSYPSMN